ncbi:MAG: prepilin-type N-terminal cleavage/methylation domain-containing protein [Kiritimatiellaeota bacterium]|nr:prepilin-type N-terminal cleavage/methylation domain-containing protein [Kiritimatiellota bacterium]
MKRVVQPGFTLLEVMIAVFILFMFMAGAYRVVTQMMWVNQSARDHYVAISLAFNRVERIRNLTDVDPSLMVESQVVITENGAPSANGNYRRTTTVTHLGTNLTAVLCQVDIRNRKNQAFDGKNETLNTVLNR